MRSSNPLSWTQNMPNPLSNVMSAKSKELLVELLVSVFKDHIELVLEEYTGMEMTPTMQVGLQKQLDGLVQMWVTHGMVNGGFRLHANYVGEPPMLDTVNPIRRETIDSTQHEESIMDSAKKKRLEDAGWVVGSTSEFLQLTPEEEQAVEAALPPMSEELIASIKEGMATPISECSTYLD